jgi:hypothetical protein
MRAPAFSAAFRVGALNPMLTATAQIATALTILIGGQQVLTNAGLMSASSSPSCSISRWWWRRWR